MDILLEYDSDLKAYDFNIVDGDIETSENYDTAIIMSLLCNERAEDTDVSNAIMRGGWFGKLINNKEYPDLPFGSKLWLLGSRVTQRVKNKSVDYAQLALSWLKNFENVKDINVSSNISDKSVIINVEFILDNGIINSYKFNGWRLTYV